MTFEPKGQMQLLLITATEVPRGSLKLREKLGEGSRGEVWRATRPDGQDVAMKFLRHAQRSEEFRHEFLLLRSPPGLLSHPGVVAVEELRLDTDPPHLIMLYAPGGDLARLIEAWDEGEAPRPIHSHSSRFCARHSKPSLWRIRWESFTATSSRATFC